MIVKLSDENFEEYVVGSYKNPNCVSILEFLDDLKKIQYIKRLLNKYSEKGELKERLILNHIILLSNVFGVEATASILNHKVGQKSKTIINSFLVYLEYVTENDVEYDEELLKRLKGKI
tara:strand:- start:1715 stop:2071 length:357 start_codon:yes stop_codon:yes gene_type:complete